MWRLVISPGGGLYLVLPRQRLAQGPFLVAYRFPRRQQPPDRLLEALDMPTPGLSCCIGYYESIVYNGTQRSGHADQE